MPPKPGRGHEPHEDDIAVVVIPETDHQQLEASDTTEYGLAIAAVDTKYQESNDEWPLSTYELITIGTTNRPICTMIWMGPSSLRRMMKGLDHLLQRHGLLAKGVLSMMGTKMMSTLRETWTTLT